MIDIQLNDQRVQLPEGTTLAALLTQNGKSPAALATAINGKFVPRTQREEHLLKEGDLVMTFEAITGG